MTPILEAIDLQITLNSAIWATASAKQHPYRILLGHREQFLFKVMLDNELLGAATAPKEHLAGALGLYRCIPVYRVDEHTKLELLSVDIKSAYE